MSSRHWLLLNLALAVLAAVSVHHTLSLPAAIKHQKTLTDKAIHAKAERQPAAKTAKNAPAAARPTAAKASISQPDTWPAIRHGSLNDLWLKSLFSKERTEKTDLEQNGDAAKDEEQLPAPPNFELIGILTANDAKIAIISLKSSAASSRAPVNNRVRRPTPRAANTPPTPTPANTNSFEPSFVTAHEEDTLQNTGFKVIAILPEENAVTLSKDNLTYRLSLDRNNANAAQRRESQNTYAASVRERNKAQTAEAQQPAAANAKGQPQTQAKPAMTPQQQVNTNRNRPPLPPGVSMPGRVTTPVAEGATGTPQPMNFRQQPPNQDGKTTGSADAQRAPGNRRNAGNRGRLFQNNQR